MPRFLEVKVAHNEWLVLDLKEPNPHVICTCKGWKAPISAEYVRKALEAYHDGLMKKFLPHECPPN